jgi:NAD(P)-dependent dehydrogenase (short-subunit alcohol dehydrogenase family)
MLTSTPHPTAPSAPRPFAIDHEEFAGRRVLVTGGTQGTGDAIVRRFAAAGAVTVTSARSAPLGSTQVASSSRQICVRPRASTRWCRRSSAKSAALTY